MAVIIGSARHDENGAYTGGKKGDQANNIASDGLDYTGEVSAQKFYAHKKGWYILRPKDKAVADKIAEGMKVACNNKNIGYNQNERLGVVTNGVWSSIATNADCSTTVRACCKYAGFDPGNFTTANEADKLEKTGQFETRIAYTSKTPLYTGDVLVTKTKGHTVVVIEGSERTTSAYYPKYIGASSSIVSVLKAVGVTDTSLSNRRSIASANGIVGYSGTASQNLQMVALAKAGTLKKV